LIQKEKSSARRNDIFHSQIQGHNIGGNEFSKHFDSNNNDDKDNLKNKGRGKISESVMVNANVGNINLNININIIIKRRQYLFKL
jgi:hypothetical protein